jgi:PAS domain S-box-containing protein
MKPLASHKAPITLLTSSFDKALDAVLITEAEPTELPGPRILYANPSFERMTGYSCDEVLGKTPRILQGPKTDRAATQRMHDALKARQPIHEELLNYRKDGSEFFVDLSIVPVSDQNGWYTHWVSIQRETTARRAAQEHAELTSRMAAVAVMAGGFAHEINNPLAVIRGFSELLLDAAGESAKPDLREGLARIVLASDRIRSLVLRVQRLAQEGRYGSRSIVPVLDFAQETVLTSRERFHQDAVSLRDCEVPASTCIACEPNELQQALLNLIQNGVESCEGEVEEPAVELQVTASEDAVAFAVLDRGPGVPESLQGSIMEPFYTTKRHAGSPGLGLSIARTIIAEHGGTLELTRRDGRTCFSFALPQVVAAFNFHSAKRPVGIGA